MLRLLVFGALFVSAYSSCPQFYSTGANGYCYRYYRGVQSFKHAAQRCAQDGGHLASALNAFGNNIVHGMTAAPPSWLGLVCPTGSSSSCAWDDGTTFSSSTYQNFAANSGAAGATCVYMQNDGTWNFDNCDTTKSFVCQVPDTETANCYGYFMGSAYCYRADYSLKTFNEGHSVCLKECGDLAYIPNQAENDKTVAGLCWECDNQNVLAKIGLTLAGDVYSWTNGKSFNPNTDYSNFAFVRPSLGNCVAIAVADTTVSGKPVKRGQWVNVSCTQYGPYVCNRAPAQCKQ